jgi:hypothetical protein
MNFEWFEKIPTAVKRALVGIGVVAFAYLAIGSLVFPEWFHSLLWDKGYSSAEYWSGGLEFWTQEHPELFYFGIAAFFVVLYLAFRYRSLLFRIIDRLDGWIFALSLLGIIIVSLAVGRYASSFLFMGSNAAQISAMNSALQQVAAYGRPPIIEAPIDFHYLDGDRVKALYSQIEPELVEQQRTVGGVGSISGKVGVKAEAVEAEIGANKQSTTNSTYQRVIFSSERQCIEVMNYLLRTNRTQYYMDDERWLSERTTTDFIQKYSQLIKGMYAPTPIPLEKIPEIKPVSSKEEQVATALRLKQYQDQMNAEMMSLQGMIIVNGLFTVTRSSQGNLELTESFAEKPTKIFFKSVVPLAFQSSRISPGSKVRLRVFGTVLHPPDEQGNIALRPTAIF